MQHFLHHDVRVAGEAQVQFIWELAASSPPRFLIDATFASTVDLARDKKSIVARSFSFKEPQRWENGLQRPDIFKSIIADDVLTASGCEIYWFKERSGYTGKSQPGQCRLRSRETGLSMNVDIAAKLTPSQYTYGDRIFHKRAVGLQP